MPKAVQRRCIYLFILVALFVLSWTTAGYHGAHKRATSAADRHRRWVARRQDSNWPGWNNISRIFAFGDSHTDTGFKPHGVQPSRFNPLGNPYFPGRTFNYGLNYLGHLTATFNESFIKTHSLAKEQSAILRRDMVMWPAPTLREQVEDVFFTRYGRSQAPGRYNMRNSWAPDDSLFVFFAGTDDLVHEFTNRVGSRNDTLFEMVIDEYYHSLKRIHEFGARHFLIVSYPQMEVAPTVRMREFERTSYLKLGGELVDLNGRLAFMAAKFAEAHSDTSVFYFDSYTLGVNIGHDHKRFPETAEYKRMEGYCYPYAERKDVLDTNQEICGNKLAEFYWRDGEHQTEPYHRLMARLIVEQIKDGRNSLPYDFP